MNTDFLEGPTKAAKQGAFTTVSHGKGAWGRGKTCEKGSVDTLVRILLLAPLPHVKIKAAGMTARWDNVAYLARRRCGEFIAIPPPRIYPSVMRTLTLDLPDALSAELDAAVEAGWFANQAEAVRAAVRDFISHPRLALQEQQQLADIEWAVNAAKQRP